MPRLAEVGLQCGELSNQREHNPLTLLFGVGILFDMFVLFVYGVPNMKLKAPKAKLKAVEEIKTDKPSNPMGTQSSEIRPEALLEEAMKEQKRVLLMDHINTIVVLRDEKKFTFRAIADWLSERGIEVDHSAIYRAYLACTPERMRNPDQDWSDVDEPGYGDENVTVKPK
jgi:hypothetical protein